MTPANDTIPAPANNDTITSGTGNDTIVAPAGNDSLSAPSGNDTLTASAANDTLAEPTTDDRLTFLESAVKTMAGTLYAPNGGGAEQVAEAQALYEILRSE